MRKKPGQGRVNQERMGRSREPKFSPKVERGRGQGEKARAGKIGAGGGWGADSGVERAPGAQGPRAGPHPACWEGRSWRRRWSAAGSALFSSLTLEWSLHFHSLCDCQALSLVLPFDEAFLQDAVFLKPYSVEYGIVLAYWFMQDAEGLPCTSH